MVDLSLKDKIMRIREEYVDGVSQAILAKKYGVSKKTIYRIVNLLAYKNIAVPEFYSHRLLIRRKNNLTVKSRKPIIMIGNKRRQGKDTFALFMKEEIESYGFPVKILHFADALKEIIAEMLGINVEKLDELKNDEKLLDIMGNKLTYRELLVRFGNGKMKKYFGKEVWKHLVMKQIDYRCYTIIPDFRFREEYIPDAITIKVERKAVEGETDLDKFRFNYVVKNDGSLDNLKNKAVEVVRKIV